MFEQEKSLRITERLPKLSSSEESQLVRLCFKGRLELIDPGESTQFPCRWLPNIEVAGMPRSGKTSLIAAAIPTIEKLGINTDLIAEQDVPFDKDCSPVLYSSVIFHRTAEALLKHEFNLKRKQLLFLERGIFDRIAFLDTLKVLGEINSEDAKITSRYIVRLFSGYVDGLIICHASPKLSLIRESPREKPGRVMNPEFLTTLQKAYVDLPNRIAQLRQETLLRNSPLLLVEISSDQEWETYLDLFIRSIGSICHRFASGGINV